MDATTLNLPPELAAKLDEAVRVIVETAHPQLVILFGSYAEGKQTEESDLDLLVVAESPDRLQTALALDSALRSVLAPLRADLLLSSPGGWERGRRLRGFVERTADREGVRLYEAA